MWPWAHAATGYLLYRLWLRYRGSALDGLSVLVLSLATLYPDLVDKPLSWTLDVLPTGRTFGHSLVIGGLIVGILWTQVTTQRAKQLLGVAAFGVLTHILGDGLRAILDGEWAELTWMLWPVLPPAEPEIGKSFMAHFLAIELTPWFGFQAVLTIAALALWYRDGVPGLSTLNDWVHRR